MGLPPLVEPVAALSDTERARTARHASLAGLGELGQRRLRAAHVAVVGAGGLGSPVVLALSAAGVGTLTVIDDDTVEVTNLQRQVMHRHSDRGALKVDSAVRTAADLSPETTVTPVTERLTAENAADLLRGAHLVIDGTDTFDTREAVAAGCERLGVPLVWGTVQEFDAQVTVFWNRPPAGTAPVGLADLYPPGSAGEVPTCAQVGVLGALCLQIGSLMATEAIKLIAGIGDPLLGRVLVVDALRARQREVPLRARPSEKAESAPEPDAARAPRSVSTPTAAYADLSSGSARAPEPTPTPPDAPAPATATPDAARTPDRASAPAAEHPADQVTVDELPGILSAPDAPTLLDVREPDEVARQPMPGARPVPLAEVLADPAAVDGPVIVVCQIGMRAQRAADALRAAGVAASVLTGGVDAWATSGTHTAETRSGQDRVTASGTHTAAPRSGPDRASASGALPGSAEKAATDRAHA